MRWAIGPLGAGSAGARADLCRTDTVARVGWSHRLVLRNRVAHAPRDAGVGVGRGVGKEAGAAVAARDAVAVLEKVGAAACCAR